MKKNVKGKTSKSRWAKLDELFDGYKRTRKCAAREAVRIEAYKLFSIEYLRRRLNGRPQTFLDEAQIRLWERAEVAFKDPSVVDNSFTWFVFGKLRSVVDGINRKRTRELPMSPDGNNEEDMSGRIKTSEYVAEAPTQADELERGDMRELLAKIDGELAKLPKQKSDVFRMVAYGGCSYLDVARVVFHAEVKDSDATSRKKIYQNRVTCIVALVRRKLIAACGERACELGVLSQKKLRKIVQ